MRRWKRERTPAAADINLSHDVSQYNIILCAHVNQDKGGGGLLRVPSIPAPLVFLVVNVTAHSCDVEHRVYTRCVNNNLVPPLAVNFTVLETINFTVYFTPETKILENFF